MIFFHTKKITQNQELIANELRRARQSKNIEIKEAALKLNISIKYLEAMENGQLEKLPAGLYGRNFLREYALLLGLNPQELLNLLETKNNINTNASRKNLFSPKAPKIYYNLILPKIIRNAIVTIILLVCFIYLGFYLWGVISPPTLVVYEPADNLTTKQNFINIQGLTEAEAEVTVNGEKVLTNPDGYFSKKINLITGINTVTIMAKKKYSQENLVVKNILVENK
jgi:cytoskeletal protein RodZ